MREASNETNLAAGVALLDRRVNELADEIAELAATVARLKGEKGEEGGEEMTETRTRWALKSARRARDELYLEHLSTRLLSADEKRERGLDPAKRFLQDGRGRIYSAIVL